MSELRTPEVEDLLTVFSKIQDKDDIFLLLEDLFTIREIRETSQRLAVARQLDAGNSYASIEKATGASATTIARVSKCLSYGAGGYTTRLTSRTYSQREVGPERKGGAEVFRRAPRGWGVIGVRCRAPCGAPVGFTPCGAPSVRSPAARSSSNPLAARQFRNPSIRLRRSPPSSFEGGGLPLANALFAQTSATLLEPR